MDLRIEQLTKHIKNNKFIFLVLGVGLVLMLLPTGKTETEIVQSMPETYVSQEEQLESVIGQIQGVGKVRILLTIAQGERTLYVYDEDISDSQGRKEAVVITDESRAQSGLVSQVLPPVYLGAVIVCQGGDQPAVRLAVVEAVGAATGLTADKISVLKMK